MFPFPIVAAEKILKGTEKLSGVQIASMTIIGLAVVFSALLILVVFLYISGSFFKKAKFADQKPAPAPQKSAPAPQKKGAAPAAASNTDEDEVVAVISAVVAAMSAADGKQYRVRSVQPVNRGGNGRSAWAQAGIVDTTRPF